MHEIISFANARARCARTMYAVAVSTDVNLFDLHPKCGQTINTLQKERAERDMFSKDFYCP